MSRFDIGHAHTGSTRPTADRSFLDALGQRDAGRSGAFTVEVVNWSNLPEKFHWMLGALTIYEE